MKKRNSTMVVVTLGLLLSVASSSASFAQSGKLAQPGARVVHRDASTGTSNSNPSGVIVHMPPAGFDPMTASDSDLAMYGLPPRPIDPTQLAQWEKAYGTVKHWIYPTFTHSNLKHDTQDPHWSGLSYNNPSQPATRVVGWWGIPFAYAPTADLPVDSSSWVGLGGIYDALIQGGTDSNITANGTYQYQPFYEIVGTNQDTGGSENVNGLNASPGDTMYADISYVNGTANFYYHDIVAARII